MEDVKEGKDYHFPREEDEILKLWDRLDAFNEQLRRSEGRPEYIFYDGPPFATGLPHYGHLLAGTIKVGTKYIEYNDDAIVFWSFVLLTCCTHTSILHHDVQLFVQLFLLIGIVHVQFYRFDDACRIL